jgi:adenylate kinase
MRIVMLGAPGSGKGTQAQRIQKDHGLPQVSTGDLLRRAVADKTPLGRQAKKAMDLGELVSDEIVLGMIKERIAQPDAQRGFVLDGFPRTLAQAQALDAMLDELDRSIRVVLHFQLPEELAEQRLLGRALESGRQDDTPDVIHKRMATMRVPNELVAYYRAMGNLVGIHADRSIDEVYGEVQNVLEAAAA